MERGYCENNSRSPEGVGRRTIRVLEGATPWYWAVTVGVTACIGAQWGGFPSQDGQTQLPPRENMDFRADPVSTGHGAGRVKAEKGTFKYHMTVF